MKKGFTMIELLGVIVILSILLIIAVPIYNHVGESINKSLYESKIREVLSKSETYAEESGKMVFDIKKLIHEGRLTADNELEEFLDPRNGRNMACDIINVSYEESYHASVRESEVCYTEEELESMYGMAHLKIVDEEGKEISYQEDTNWLKENKVYVTYELHNENAEVESLIWNGEQEIHCEKEKLANCSRYEISANSIKSVLVNLRITMKIKEALITSQISKEVNLDIQRPRVIDGSVNVNNELSTANNRRVDFELTDGGGSGVKEYAIVKERTCKGSEYDQKKKSARDGIQTEYLENGDYYICVEDQVGNRTSEEDLENVANQIHVSNIDKGSPVIHEFSIRSRESYKSLKTVLTINSSDDNGIENLKMCISNTGYLKDCSWERYNTTKNWDLPGSLDGVERTVYLSIQDASGNITNREAKYTPYKECSSTNKVTVGGFGACSVSCGGGVQYQNYQNKDKNTGKVCSTGKNERKCNEQSCAPTITRVGDYLTGLLVPLNNHQFLEFKTAIDWYGGGRKKDCDSCYYSSVTGRIININNLSAKYEEPQVLTNGKDALGTGDSAAVRVDDNTVIFSGASYYHYSDYGSKHADYGAMTIKVNGNRMTVVNKKEYEGGGSKYWDGLVGIGYKRGASTAEILISTDTKTYYKHCLYTYDLYNAGAYTSKNCSNKSDYFHATNAKHDIEGIVGASGIPRSGNAYERIGLNNGTALMLCADGTIHVDYCENNNIIIKGDTWRKYGFEYRMGHMGNDKIVVMTYQRKEIINGKGRKDYVYDINFVFYKLENGVWKFHSAIELPEKNQKGYWNGTFVSIDDKTIAFNISSGLYFIRFE